MKERALILSVVGAAMFVSATLYAYDFTKNGDRVRSNEVLIDLDMDGVKEKISLEKEVRNLYGDELVDNAKIRVESNGKVFTKDVGEKICPKASELEVAAIPDVHKRFVAVSSCDPELDRGWKLIIFSYDGKEVKKEITLTSDEPSIEVKDPEGDGVEEIVVTNRDFLNDPEKDKILTTYEYVGEKWQPVSVYRTKTNHTVGIKTKP